MGDTARECGGTVHQTSEVSDHFAFKAKLSIAAVMVLGALGLLAIAITVTEIDGNLAVYMAGIAACSCALTMVIAWGAASGHAELARLAITGHERLNNLIAERLDNIEAIERQTGNAVVIALDDLRERRAKRGG